MRLQTGKEIVIGNDNDSSHHLTLTFPASFDPCLCQIMIWPLPLRFDHRQKFCLNKFPADYFVN